MMLPGPRLLLRAVLLLGTARSALARPESEWSTPGTPGHMSRSPPADSRPHRLTWGPEPGTSTAAGTPAPPQDASAGREGLMTEHHGLGSSELSFADPKEIQVRDPPRTSTDPNRTDTGPPSVPNRTDTGPPSVPNRTDTGSSSEPNRTDTGSSSEPNRTDTGPPSEPNRTDTGPPSEPNRTDTGPSSVPNRTDTNPTSEPNRTDAGPPSEPNRSDTGPPSEPNRSDTGPSSEPNRTDPNPTSEPNRTDTGPPSEPNRSDTGPSSEPNRADPNPTSEPNRTDPNPTSEPNRTDLNPTSEPNRTDSPSFSTDTGKIWTLVEPGQTERHLGPHIYYRSEPDWKGMEITQTSSVPGVTEKSATQRHLNKRTPHMDTTHISTPRGGDRTLLSVTSNFSDITEIPNTYPTNTGGQKSGNTANITQHSLTTAADNRNSTEDDEGRNTSSQSGASVPGTYPLQTPSYVVTTYPSPTSHMSNSTFPFTSVPVTVPNTTSDPKTTGIPSNNSSMDLSPSDASLPGVESSSSGRSLAATTSATSSSPPRDVTPQSHQTPSALSSSPPVSSTLVSAARSSVSPSPKTDTPEISPPAGAPSSTPGSPSSSLPLITESTPGEKNETFPSTSPPAETANNTSPAVTPETVLVTTERRSYDETTTIPEVTSKPTEETQTATTWRSTEGTRLIGASTQSADHVPSTTSTNIPLTPSPHYTTPEKPHHRTTGPGSSTPTTGDPNMKVAPEGTPRMDLNTETPRPDTAGSTTGKKILPPPPSTAPPVSSAAATSPPTAAASLCSPSPCHNGGLCVERGDWRSYRCDCPAAWTGDLCSTDVDECLSSPCPALSTCINSKGSFSCQCPLGYLLEMGAGCVLVRTFIGHIEIPWSFLDGADVKDGRLDRIKADIAHVLNSSFSIISGYYQSTVTSDSHTNSNNLIVQNFFSLESNVTMFDLSRSLQSYAKVCETSPERPTSCQLVLHLQHRIRALSLCNVRSPGCDNETAECADPAGVAFCRCKPGYFKYSKTDHSCRACDDGYKLENEACVRCPFGLGGFNCSNPYQLITVIIAAAGGGLLLILVVALTVTCCRKGKHDISKLIFKSGDFQMSPYAEYPKTPRSSEWGRETIEMQENGSTKNLLQMTDVYYSPALRNSEIERNGLYPYTGPPGSRHSCIYPGQYNPSFINEENRRRDYF
ncbi:protein HEG homolog 1 [Rhinoderma darwinii]|uniref:protein HEG homolog 1 n=1 Tax=Rhinoderma darwinii TaxID=43563 RepID=UPI003F678338